LGKEKEKGKGRGGIGAAVQELWATSEKAYPVGKGMI
jgi:hypothetical protein